MNTSQSRGFEPQQTNLRVAVHRVSVVMTVVTAVALFFVSQTVLAQFVVPELTGPVIDNARVLSPEARRVGEQIIREIQARGTAQIQVLIVDSLDGDSIESASMKVVEKWQLGTEKKDNGVLFMAAIKDRRMRIEVGQGLEGDLPDVIAKRIIADRVTPYFRGGKYSEGVIVAIGEIARNVDPTFAGLSQTGVDGASEARHVERRAPKSKLKSDFFVFFLFFMWLVIIKIFGRRRHYLWGAGSGWSSGSSSWGSGRGWSSGSSGGWSGGGGGFSGGGASGGW